MATLDAACAAVFSETEDTVVCFLSVEKQAQNAAWGRLTSGVSSRKKGRVLCATMARDETSRALKAKLHVLKALDSGGRESGELHVSYTFKLKLLSRVELSGKGDLSMVLDGKVYAWGCEDETGIARFVGCLSSLTREHLRRPLTVDGIDGPTLERWIEDYEHNRQVGFSKSETGGGDSSLSGNNRASDEASAASSNRYMLSSQEEQDLQNFLDKYDMDVGKTKSFEMKLRRELSDLEAENVSLLVQNGKQADSLMAQLGAAENHLDDLEAWLAIFNVKLTHMREDVETIEARNNELELKSRNSGSLIKHLKDFLLTLALPPGVEDVLENRSFHDNDMEFAVNAAYVLHEANLRTRHDTLGSLAQMKAVHQRVESFERLTRSFTRRTTAYLKSYFEAASIEFLEEQLKSDHRGVPLPPSWHDLHCRINKHKKLLNAMYKLDASCVMDLLRNYCTSCNTLLRRQVRETAGMLRQLISKVSGSEHTSYWTSSGNGCLRADEAFIVMVQNFVPLLVGEAEFIDYLFNDTPEKSKSILESEIRSSHSAGSGGNVACASEMALLIEGIQDEFMKLADSAATSNPILCITMLGAIGRALAWTGERAGDVLVTTLTLIQARLQLHLSRFLDEKKVAIEKHEGRGSVTEAFGLLNPTGCVSVLPEVAKFPALVKQFESLMDETLPPGSFEDKADGRRRAVVDHAYMKLLTPMLQYIEKTASADSKRAERIKLTNYLFLEDNIHVTDASNVLSKHMELAKQARVEATRLYISKACEKHFGKVLDVAVHIHGFLESGVSPEDISIQAGCGREAVIKVLNTALGSHRVAERAIQALHKQLQKHFGISSAVYNKLWVDAKAFILGWLHFLEDKLLICYSFNMSPSTDELRELFKQF